MRRAAVFAAFALSACTCGDETACSQCPPLEGTYAMSYDSAQAASCDLSNWRPATVAITRVGSTARSSLYGVDLSGTLFDSFRFQLTGATSIDGGSVSIDLHGTFVPPSNATDGGSQIRGEYAVDQIGCSETWPYVGTKQ